MLVLRAALVLLLSFAPFAASAQDDAPADGEGVAGEAAVAEDAPGEDASAEAEPEEAAAPQKVSVVLLVGKGKKAPQLKGPVKRHIEKKLKETFDVIDFKKVRKAARKAKIKPKDIATVDNAKTIAPAVEATHVVLISSSFQEEEIEGKKRKKKIFFADVSVIDVASGETVHTNPYALEGRKLTPAVAEGILADVTQKLTLTPAEAPPVEEEPAEEPVAEAPPPPDAPPAPEGGEAAAEGAEVAAAEGTEAAPPIEGGQGEVTEAGADPLALGGMVDDGGAPAEGGDATDAGTEGGFGGELAAFVDEPEPTVATEAPRRGANPPRWRPAIRLMVGALALQRDGTMKSDDQGIEPPCYCGEEGESNPFFPALYIGAEFYPGSLAALSGKGEVWEGIGLHLETFITQVKTVVDPATDDSVDSNVFGLNGGASFRYVFWDAETAPDAKVKIGVEHLAFPLRVGVFPGVKYTGPYAGLDFDLPLGVPMAALLVGGHYNFAVGASGKTKRLGDQDGGSGFRAEVGARLSFAPVEATVKFRWQPFKTQYTGETTLNAAAEFNDVTLDDRFLGFLIAAGVAF